MKNRGKFLFIGAVLILIIGVAIFLITNNIKPQQDVSINSNDESMNSGDIIELEPIVQVVNGINVIVDPRIELLAAVQLISDYDKRTNLLTSIRFDYKNDMKDYFSKYSDHEAVKLFNNMSKQGFSYDAPPTVMLYLSNPLELSKKLDFTDYLIGRAGGSNDLDKFISTMQKFVIDTKFNEFYENHKDFYKEVVEKNAEVINQGDYIKDIEGYYGMKQNSYNIILSPLFHPGGFGPRVKNGDGAYDIYSIQGPTKISNEWLMFGSIEGFRFTAWHEFSHSFVNPLTEENLSEINKYIDLFSPVAEKMRSQGYSKWEISVNEHIVRAVTSRLTFLNEGKDAYDEIISIEKFRGFNYVEALCEKLEEYENNRDVYKSFKDFYPQLIEVFKELSEKIN